MLELCPYLFFDGNCAEAMTFYRSCLGGELSIVKVSDSPMGTGMPPGLADRVLHARLESGAISLAASDWLHQDRRRVPGNTVCCYVEGGSGEETRAIFDTLSAGAEPALLDDMRDLPFGSYGALTDRYGVRWMFRAEAPAPAGPDRPASGA